VMIALHPVRGTREKTTDILKTAVNPAARPLEAATFLWHPWPARTLIRLQEQELHETPNASAFFSIFMSAKPLKYQGSGNRGSTRRPIEAFDGVGVRAQVDETVALWAMPSRAGD